MNKIFLMFLVLGMALSASEPWRYEARLSTDSKVLLVEGWLPAGVDGTFSVDEGAEPFVSDVAMEQNGAWAAIEKAKDAWYPPTKRALHFRYRFNLEGATKTLRGLNKMNHLGTTTMASPAIWILRPWKADPATPMQIHCSLPKGIFLVTGLATSADGETIEDTYDHLDYAPYTAFGNFTVDRFASGGVAVQVATLPDSLAVTREDLRAWCGHAIANLRTVFSAFPDSRLVVFVFPSGGNGVVFGSTVGSGGPAVSILMARSATSEDLRQDWILTHECIHLAHPSLPRMNHWFEEGLATYLEPLMRARRGVITEEDVWKNFAEQLPNGLPKPGSLGLDQDRGWGATYWGGTLFFLLADVKIREVSGDRKSLDDALRAIVQAGGNHEARWDLPKTLAIGDRAVGGHVLRDLHAQMGMKANAVDLKELFQRLGVNMRKGHVTFADTAPLAAIRRSMTAAK